MAERIIIRNFGPLREVEINDIKPFLFLIGPSGSGKSTIIKMLAFMRWIYKMMNIRSYLYYSGVKVSSFKLNIKKHLKLMGMDDFLQKETFIEYTNGSYSFVYDKKVLPFKKKYIPREELSLEKISFMSERRTVVSEINDGTLSIKKRSFYANEVHEDYQRATEAVNEFGMPGLGVKLLVKKTANGTKHYVESSNDVDNYSIFLTHASSGIQSSIPMAVITEYFTKHFDIVEALNKSVLSFLSDTDSLKYFRPNQNIGEIPHRRVSLFVEEPEISLYPYAQRDLMNYMVGAINTVRDYEMSLVVGTHSPYIISNLNVMLRRQSPAPHIKSEKIQVYMVAEGHLQDLVAYDEDTGETVIDSRDLSETMAAIFAEYQSLGHETAVRD